MEAEGDQMKAAAADDSHIEVLAAILEGCLVVLYQQNYGVLRAIYKNSEAESNHIQAAEGLVLVSY